MMSAFSKYHVSQSYVTLNVRYQTQKRSKGEPYYNLLDPLHLQREGAGSLANDTRTDNKTLERFYLFLTAKGETLEEDNYQALHTY